MDKIDHIASSPAAPRILVVDDDREIANLVTEVLRKEGLEAHACYSGKAALEAFGKGSFSLVILDVMMPGMDGLEVCRKIRTVSETPVIFLSAKAEEADKVVGLTLGGDDYIAKPFGKRELVARVRARLRQARTAQQGTSGTLGARGIEVDPISHKASLHGEPLALTPKEFDILTLLLKNAGRPVPAAEIYETIWQEMFNDSAANSVMVHIRRLRAKLAAVDESEDFIETAWGVDYRISPRARNRR